MSRLGDAWRAFRGGSVDLASTIANVPDAQRSTESQGHPHEYYITTVPDGHALPAIDDLIARHGIAVYREMRLKDDAVASSLALLVYARLSTELKISAASSEPLDEAIAEANRENFERAGGLLRYQENGYDCLGAGFACIEKRWAEPSEWTSKTTQQAFHLQFMRGLVPMPQETIAIKRDDYGDIEPDGIWQSKARQIVTPSLDPVFFNHLNARDFVVFSWNRQWDNPYGMSLLRAAHRWYAFKDQMIRAWARHLERFGFPLLKVKVDKSVPAGERARLIAEVQRFMTSQGVIGHADIEAVEMNNSTVAKYVDAIHEANRAIARACLQPALTMENQGTTGSNALGTAQQNTFAWPIENLGQHGEQELIRKGVIEDFTRWNFGDRVELPKVRYDDFKNADLIAIATLFEIALRIGMTIPEPYARTILGIPEPKNDEAALKPQAPVIPTQLPDSAAKDVKEEERAKLSKWIDAALYAASSKDSAELQAVFAGQSGPALPMSEAYR